MSLPDLPERADGLAYSTAVHEAYDTLRQTFDRAQDLLSLRQMDPLRYQIHINIIKCDIIPLLEAMESQSINEGIPEMWIKDALEAFAETLLSLSEAAQSGNERAGLRTTVHDSVTLVRNSYPGRPRKQISKKFLLEASKSGRNLSDAQISRLLGTSARTVRNYRRLYNIKKQFSDITDNNLDRLMRKFKISRPNAGIRYVTAYLRSRGIKVQRRRVIDSLTRVDGIGQVLRDHRRIRRRVYKSAQPNYLWHCDGHHKMIRWGIVIHGFIDGYCRTVTGLQASNNNLSSSVLDVFFQAIGDYGIPSRLRGDRGGENIDVATMMVLLRGQQRASFIWGTSTHNTRIERLWAEVGSQFVRRWRAFFQRLEDVHHLDIDNQQHIWLLQKLFLPEINQDCRKFQTEWNTHPIRGSTTYNRSPNDLRFLGIHEHGLYSDDCDQLSIHDIKDLYHTYIKQRLPGSRAHRSRDVDIADSDDGDEWVDEPEEDNDMHLNPAEESVQVVETEPAFAQLETEHTFFLALAHLTEKRFVPDGYGVKAGEWPNGSYPTVEVLKVGKKREVPIDLPKRVWLPKAELWVRALHLMIETQEYEAMGV